MEKENNIIIMAKLHMKENLEMENDMEKVNNSIKKGK